MSGQAPQHLFTSLISGRLLTFVAKSIIGVFFPIFLYELFGGEVLLVVAFFLLANIVHGMLVPAAGLLFNRIGFKTAMIVGLTSASIFNLLLYALDRSVSSDTLVTLLVLAFIAWMTYRLLFWVPFHTEFAKSSNRKKRGTQMGILFGVLTIIAAIAPAISGYLTATFGYYVLFIVATIFMALSCFPFSRVPNYDETFSWGYKETFRKLFAKENRRLVIASATAGIDSVLGVVIWPLFIFLLLKGDYIEVGLISSFIVAATALLQLVLGRYLDVMPKGVLLRAGSIFSAIGWMIKIFVTTATQAFLVGIYHNVAKSSFSLSYNAFFYEIAADGGHYIDEYTVLREMAIQLGKAVALAVVLVLLLFVSLQWTFFVGVISAIVLSLTLSRVVPKQSDDHQYDRTS